MYYLTCRHWKVHYTDQMDPLYHSLLRFSLFYCEISSNMRIQMCYLGDILCLSWVCFSSNSHFALGGISVCLFAFCRRDITHLRVQKAEEWKWTTPCVCVCVQWQHLKASSGFWWRVSLRLFYISEVSWCTSVWISPYQLFLSTHTLFQISFFHYCSRYISIWCIVWRGLGDRT